MDDLVLQVREYIGKGRTDAAIDLLMSSLMGKSEELHKKVILISASYSSLKNNYLLGTIPTIELNQINLSLLNLTSEIEKEVKLLSEIFDKPVEEGEKVEKEDDRGLHDVYIEYGNSYLMGFEFELAQETFQKALSFKANSIDAINGLEICNLGLGNSDQKSFVPNYILRQRALLLRKKIPNSIPLLLFLAIIEFRLDDFEEAKRLCLQVISLAPGYSLVYIQLGYMYQAHQDLERAKEYYSLAILHDSKNADAHNNLGYMYRLDKDFDKSAHHLEKAIRLRFNFLTLLNLSDSYRYTRRFHASQRLNIAAVDFMTEYDGDELPSHFLLGDWMYNYMPLIDNKEISKHHVLFRTKEEKMSLFYFGSWLDGVFLDQLDDANRSFDLSIEYDEHGDYKNYYANQILSVIEVLQIKNDDDVFPWIADKYKFLTS